MKTITFRNGDPMPLFGLGTYQSKANELHDAIISALKDGYRLIDCAAYYKNEEIIGAALQETFTSGLVKREKLFITSKLWNNNHAGTRGRSSSKDVARSPAGLLGPVPDSLADSAET